MRHVGSPYRYDESSVAGSEIEKLPSVAPEIKTTSFGNAERVRLDAGDLDRFQMTSRAAGKAARQTLETVASIVE